MGKCFDHAKEGFPFNWFPQRVGNSHCRSLPKVGDRGFHSIGFPSEQGIMDGCGYQSSTNKKFPFNWFPQRVGNARHDDWIGKRHSGSFHSIGFPSEQGTTDGDRSKPVIRVFPFNWFPQRVGNHQSILSPWRIRCFHSIGFPSEQGTQTFNITGSISGSGFHSIGFPSEQGKTDLIPE